MVIDYNSDVYEKEHDEVKHTWEDLEELIKTDQIYNALGVLQREIDSGKDEINCRLTLARLIENNSSETKDYALDQYDSILKLDENQMDALAGKARLAALEEIKSDQEAGDFEEYDEEEEILKLIVKAQPLAVAKKTVPCLAISTVLWGSGLIILKRKIGFLFFLAQVVTLATLLSSNNLASITNFLFEKGGLSFQKIFSFEPGILSGYLYYALIILAVINLLLSFFITMKGLKTNNSTGRVLKLDGERCFFNLGENRLVSPGDIFKVMKTGSFKNAGGKTEQRDYPIGSIRVDYVRELFSKGTFRGFRGEMTTLPELNDRVELI